MERQYRHNAAYAHPNSTQYSMVAPLAHAQGLALVAATVESPPNLRTFDLRTSLVVPPEIYLTSTIASLLDDLKVPCLLADGTQIDLTFRPMLVLEDRNDRNTTTPIALNRIFQRVGELSGVTVWRYNAGLSTAPPTLASNWMSAGRLRFTWRNISSPPIEASLFEPVPRKLVVLQPFSGVSARMAVVAFADRPSPRTPLFQRTVLFGDAASNVESKPDVEIDGTNKLFLLSLQERQKLDIPIPDAALLDLILLKYLPLGQVLCCGRKNVT